MSEETRFSSLQVIEYLRDKWAINASRQLVNCIIRRLGFTYKRSKRRGGGEKIQKATRTYLQAFTNAWLKGSLASIDESGFDQRAQPVYAYALRGKPAILRLMPCRDRTRYNLVMSIHSSGSSVYDLNECRTTGAVFERFIKGLPYARGTTLLLDNVSVHRTAAVRQAAEQKGYELLFTPAYSPEYNPIELTFGEIKCRFYKMRYFDDFGEDFKGLVERCIEFVATKRAHARGCFQNVNRMVESELASAHTP
jgi:transposase